MFTIDTIYHFAEFTRVIDQVELPDQMVSALESRYFHHILACSPDASVTLRLGYWLEQYLNDTVLWRNQTGQTDQAFGLMLTKVLALTRITKPLGRLFYGANVEWQCQLLTTYAQMLLSWYQILSPTWPSPLGTSLAEIKPPLVNYELALREFMVYTERLCGVALQISNAPTKFQVPCLVTPSYPIFHQLFFSGIGATVSQLMGIIANYRLALDIVDLTHAQSTAFDLPSEFIAHIQTIPSTVKGFKAAFSIMNGLGFFTHLWQFLDQAMSTPGPTPPCALPFAQRLTSEEYKRINQQINGYDTMSEFRLAYLDSLQQLGYHGLCRFIRLTMLSHTKRSDKRLH
ncbi:hypothetical protein H4R35_005989 [Dimargaris xerosporica]|nr:hypothetical protein H4R35_005989 [Dimargaris xerosporica]